MGSELFILQVDLLIYSILFNVIMMIYLYTQERRKSFSRRVLFVALTTATFISIAEVLTWLCSEVGIVTYIPLRYVGNILCIGLGPLPGCIGLVYLDYKIYDNEQMSKKRAVIYMLPVYFSVLFMIYNYFNLGAVFYIDEMNHYHRGYLLYLSVAFMYVFMLGVSISFFLQKRLMTSRVMKATGFYFLVPVTGLLIQLLTYGTTFTMPSHTMAIFIVFLLLERDEMAKDTLTSLYTRYNFENSLKRKLKSNESFTMILADLNDFKMINDTYGHSEGDRVLQRVAEILLHSTSVEDLVCRYGGDEFFLLIENHKTTGQSVIEKINQSIARYNRSNNGYQVGISFGELYVKSGHDKSMEELVIEVDRKMYEEKSLGKRRR